MFSELFGFQSHALVNFVGGGGKTSLIRKLAEEFSPRGPVLCTATIRIHPPDPADGFVVISGDNIDLLRLMVRRIGEDWADCPVKLSVGGHFVGPRLLKEVPPDFNNAVDRKFFPILLNEADSAEGFCINMPEEHGPVLMQNAEYLVPVVGIDCLNLAMGPAVVCRWNLLADELALREGDRFTAATAAAILMHPEGVCRKCRPGTTILPFINKVDEPSQDGVARELAAEILRNPAFPVERVLYGSLLQGRAESVSLQPKP